MIQFSPWQLNTPLRFLENVILNKKTSLTEKFKTKLKQKQENYFANPDISCRSNLSHLSTYRNFPIYAHLNKVLIKTQKN